MKKKQEIPEYLRVPGRAARSTLSGLAGIGNLAQIPLNAGRSLSNKHLGTNFEQGQMPSEAVRKLIDDFTYGSLTPQNELEQLVDGANEAITSLPLGGAGAVSKIANPRIYDALSKLSIKTVPQLFGAAGAGAALTKAQIEFPDNPIAQFIAALAGGYAGSKVGTKPSAGNIAKINPGKVAQYKQAGLQAPSVGSISDSKVINAIEYGAKHSPLFHNPFTQAIEKTKTKIGNIIHKGSTKLESGTALQGSLKRNIEKADAITEKLFTKKHAHVKGNQEVPLNGRLNEFLPSVNLLTDEARELLSNSPGGKKLDELINASNPKSKLISSPILDESGKPFTKDISKRKGVKDSIPYEDLQIIRKDVINTLSKQAVGTIDNKELTTINKALGEAEKDFFHKISPESVKDYERANSYYTKLMEKRNQVVKPILHQRLKGNRERDKRPTESFNKLYNTLKVDGHSVKSVLSGATGREREAISQGLIDELGKNTHNEFSAKDAMNNFYKLEPEAQNVLLSGLPKHTQNSYRKVFKVLKENEDLVAGDKGLAEKVLYHGLKAPYAASLWMAPFSTAATTATGYGTAKLLTNPKFINWLANSTKLKTDKQAATYMSKLFRMAEEEPELAEPINQYIEEIQKNDTSKHELDNMSDEELHSLMAEQANEDLDNMTDEELIELYQQTG